MQSILPEKYESHTEKITEIKVEKVVSEPFKPVKKTVETINTENMEENF